MEIKVKNRIRQKPVILGLRLKSFFILLFSCVMLMLLVLGSFSLAGVMVVCFVSILEYGLLYYYDNQRSDPDCGFPDRIENM